MQKLLKLMIALFLILTISVVSITTNAYALSKNTVAANSNQLFPPTIALETKSKLIGKAGGSITLGNGATIKIEPNSLDKTIEISFKRIKRPPESIVDGNIVSDFYELTPHGQQFSYPVEIVLPYKKMPSHFDVFETAMYVRDDNEANVPGINYVHGKFSIVTPAVQQDTELIETLGLGNAFDHFQQEVDVKNKVVRAYVMNFSYFVLTNYSIEALLGEGVKDNLSDNEPVNANQLFPPTIALETKSKLIGKAGGSITLGNGATIKIEPNSLDKAVEITFKRVLRPPGSVIDGNIVSDFYELTPHGQQFSYPVEIVLPYKELPSQFNIFKTHMYTRDDSSISDSSINYVHGNFRIVPPAIQQHTELIKTLDLSNTINQFQQYVDIKNKVVRAYVMHFSYFCVSRTFINTPLKTRINFIKPFR